MSEIRETIVRILDGQQFAVLATLGADSPYTNLVAFSCVGDIGTLVFLTSRHSSKYENIRRNPGVSLFVDTRSNRASDIESAVGISAVGAATLLDDDRKEAVLVPYLARHPYLADFARDRDTVAVRVSVSSYTMVRNFSRVDFVDLGGEGGAEPGG